MKTGIAERIKKGGSIVYNDGRPGHECVAAVVVAVNEEGMTVLFEDRADTNFIKFSDRQWMDFISLAD